MKKRVFTFIAMLFLSVSVFYAQSEEDSADDDFTMTYSLGVDYTYAFDLPYYKTIPMYQTWQKGMDDFSPKLIDNLGSNGHILQITNQFEWRKNVFSFTAFANITMNYIPAFFDTSLKWVPACFNGGMACFEAAANIWSSALSEGWLLINVCTLFMFPAVSSGCCILAGVLCFAAIPVSIVVLAAPMFNIGGSFDYHPLTTDFFDTKLSIGADINGYRGIFHDGFFGIFAQAEAAVLVSHLRFYAQAGYRADVLNIAQTFQDTRNETRYVPAPYLRAGLSWTFGI